MKITIHQPNFFPWLGLLDKIAKADLLVILDNVQANKSANHYRNIFYCSGKQMMLTLPVNYSMGIMLNELTYKRDNWIDDHLNKLSNYYSKAPFYNEVYPEIVKLYHSNVNRKPIDFIINSMLLLMSLLQIGTQTILNSKLNNAEWKKGELVFNICAQLKASNYLSGQGAHNYMLDENFKAFKNSNIEIEWHKFNHPKYNQFQYHFLSGLSGLDLLFFEGLENSRKIFWSNVNNASEII